jgi:hypothetical protein
MNSKTRDNEHSAATDCYTPGPWILDDRGYSYIVANSRGEYVTRDVCRMDASTMAAFEQQGNAKLIAAAPELLAAIQKVLADECSDEKMCYEIGGYVLDDDVREQCQAAITKAVGG